MLGIVIFTAILSGLIGINGTPLSNKELQAIVKVLQGQVESENAPEISTSDSGEGDNDLVHYLNSDDVIKLIQKANEASNREGNDYNIQKHRTIRDSMELHNLKHHHIPSKSGKSHNHGWNEVILQNFLNGQLKKPPQKASHRHHLVPNRLTNTIKNVKLSADDDQSGLSDYSKIFLILDPVAIQDSKNNDVDGANLISRILAQSSSAIQKSYQDRNRPSRYKGFMVKDSTARRFRRESKEMYGGGGGGGGGGGDDDDYRPKRQRNDNRGGGGGGGRTAIPYIRHRGDIYERDH